MRKHDAITAMKQRTEAVNPLGATVLYLFRVVILGAVAIYSLVFACTMPTYAQTQPGMIELPPDASELIDRRTSCENYSAKGRADPTFAAGLAPVMAALRCNDVQKDEGALRERYRNKPQIIVALDAKWVKLVQRVQAQPVPKALSPDD
jgi:hypothetical protein